MSRRILQPGEIEALASELESLAREGGGASRVLQSGKGFMNAMTDIPPEIGDTIIASIIYFAATSVLIRNLIERARRRFAK